VIRLADPRIFSELFQSGAAMVRRLTIVGASRRRHIVHALDAFDDVKDTAASGL
jgi:hypothetical protein